MIYLCLATQGAIQRSLDEIAEGQVRRGQIWRRSFDEVCGLNPAGCLLGQLIYTPEFRVGQVKSAFWIVIGRQSGMLWMLWAQEGSRMLHWGTPVWPAGSRPISWKRRILIGCWPRSARRTGSRESWIPIGWWPKLGRWASRAGCWIFIGWKPRLLSLTPTRP